MADEGQEETATPEVEQEHPEQTPPVAPVPEDLPPAEPITDEGPPLKADEPAPLEPAQPGIYWCETENPGRHPVLGGLVEGENDFSGVTHPDELLAIAALVQAGVLEPMDQAKEPPAEAPTA